MSSAARFVLAAASLLTLAACDSPTAPAPRTKSANVKPNLTCSGYTTVDANGNTICVS